MRELGTPIVENSFNDTLADQPIADTSLLGETRASHKIPRMASRPIW